MDIVRFKKILEYSECNKRVISEKIQDFYERIGVGESKELRNVLQLARPLFQKQGYIIVEVPFKDEEIGAVCYNGDGLGYALVNSSCPEVNVNFALCHEIYHLLYQEESFKKLVELYMNEHYYEHEEELAANLFAGMLLMPEESFCFMFHKFAREEKAPISVLALLMSYFEVPYMAALVRCYELKLLESGEVLSRLMHVSREDIQSEFTKLWLDERILEATKKDDYHRLERFVRYTGLMYQEEGYLNNAALDKAIGNMRKIYGKIKGEC